MRTIAAEIRTAFDRTPPQHNDTLPACRAGRSDGRGVRLGRRLSLALLGKAREGADAGAAPRRGLRTAKRCVRRPPSKKALESIP